MRPTLRPLFWIEAGLAATTGLLALVSLFWQDSIEALTGFDPDSHDGSVEWLIVIGLAVVALFSLAARASRARGAGWRRLTFPIGRATAALTGPSTPPSNRIGAMTIITDVSPTALNTAATSINHSVIGRMLSIGWLPNGERIFALLLKSLEFHGWRPELGATDLAATDWDQFTAPGSLGGWCITDIAACLGWRVDKHPEVSRPAQAAAISAAARLSDIVGFGDCGVWTSLGNGDGTFQPPKVVIDNLGYQAGGWRVGEHPRFVVDLNNDGRANIVGFGYDGIWTAIGNGDGTFQTPQLVLQNFGLAQDWHVDRHPRFLARLTNSGFADIVGFGEDGVWVALGNGDGTFRKSLRQSRSSEFQPRAELAGRPQPAVSREPDEQRLRRHRRLRDGRRARRPRQRRRDVQRTARQSRPPALRLFAGLAGRPASAHHGENDAKRIRRHHRDSFRTGCTPQQATATARSS